MHGSLGHTLFKSILILSNHFIIKRVKLGFPHGEQQSNSSVWFLVSRQTVIQKDLSIEREKQYQKGGRGAEGGTEKEHVTSGNGCKE